MTEAPIIINDEKELGSEPHALVAPSRKEPGVLVYELHFEPDSPGKFMFYGKFQSYLKTKGNPIAAPTMRKDERGLLAQVFVGPPRPGLKS
jgi:hypothetical protein